MNLDSLFGLLTEARKLCGHAKYVVIGSLSILGVADIMAIPADMTLSIDAGCYARNDPGRTLDLQMALGEGSDFHKAHGIYLDPVNPRLPTLPQGWEARLIKVARNGVVASFLEPHDAAVSKLARGEARDLRWVRAGVKANILAVTTVKLRMKDTTFLDEEEQRAAMAHVEKIKGRPIGRVA